MPDNIESRIQSAMLADQHRLRKLLRAVERNRRAGKPTAAAAERLSRLLLRSMNLCERRRRNAPAVSFDNELPITAKHDEIATAIQQSRVVVVCGETGSGKSTQLPKICLEIGRGVRGFIGHTQPRRIAARSVAARLAEELDSTVGQHVGFKIRFTDVVGPETYVKLMTDGVLLAETQHDRFLDQYDMIIVDEAHERSLNIDFLLGYLKRLLPKRPDLRLIITSATIDAARFAEHFSFDASSAPVIEVSGRAYPIETRYRPLEEAEEDEEGEAPRARQSVVAAVEELCGEGPGDILVFLPTERHIRDVAKQLRGWATGARKPADVLPLYARLPAAEQNRIFQPGKRRRIVLATNVAESSLTVPGIRYVVDTGTARISRYSPRSKVQRLPIEPISQASADQRQGRCGRIGPGICIREYGEQDYLARDRYTTPEIRRSNLAAVILQMLALRLGDIEKFPFLDPPRRDAIRDGYKTLYELGATDDRSRLTEIGRRMSRLPVDPRIARMILAGDREDCLAEILIIGAALETQDPRERPADKEELADRQHARFADDRSDFMSYLKIWDFYHHLKKELSRSKLRKACKENFLSMNRIREWQDIHRQLRQLAAENGYAVKPRRDEYDSIHRALLTGLLSNVALRVERRQYQGVGGATSFLWPGSGLSANKPKWILAAEAVETSRRFLRTAARIRPEWIEPLAGHLIERSYSDPSWSRKRGTVLAKEKVTLFGLTISAGRRKRYATVDPGAARRLFIQHALVEGDFDSNLDFFVQNRQLVQDLAKLAAKLRNPRLLVSDIVQYSFYDERLPEAAIDAASLRRWLRRAAPEEVRRLQMDREDLVPDVHAQTANDAFPDRIQAGLLQLPVDYCYEPGDEADGLTATVPREALRWLDESRIDWLAPGLLHEKLVALIRSLPKPIRRNLVPAPDTASKAVEMMQYGCGPFLPTVAAVFSQLAGERVTVDAFRLDRLPQHLRMNIRVVDEEGRVVAQGRELAQLRGELGIDRSAQSGFITDDRWHRDGVTTWDLGDLPERVALRRGDVTVTAFPALIDAGDRVSLRLVDSEESARRSTRAGLRRLVCLRERRELKLQVDWLPRINDLELLASNLKQKKGLRRQLMDLLADLAYLADRDPPRTEEAFRSTCEAGRERLLVAVQDATKLIGPLLETHHQVQLALDEAASPRCAAAVRDMRDQLADLTAEGYLVETPWTWLVRYPRYFQAILIRLDKLKSSGYGRDVEAMRELQPLLDAYRQRRKGHEERGIFDPELEQYRWMLEELRVSLFAQQLGTVLKVSPNRLKKHWPKVRL